jgi:hypothetical protein
MKHILHTISILLFILALLFASPQVVLADEGDGGHQLEVEVNGYHVTLENQDDWVKGENTIVVTLTDSMGMPLSNADVEILVTPKLDEHAEVETDSHGTEQEHDSMSGMDMGEPAEETTAHVEEVAVPISMLESHKHGMYMVETHLESSGEHEVHIMFHANGEMLQADFVVEIPGASSKTIVLWSFVTINVALVTSAGIMKKQPITVKGGK